MHNVKVSSPLLFQSSLSRWLRRKQLLVIQVRRTVSWELTDFFTTQLSRLCVRCVVHTSYISILWMQYTKGIFIGSYFLFNEKRQIRYEMSLI